MSKNTAPKVYPILNFRKEFCPLLMRLFYSFLKFDIELKEQGEFLLLLNIRNRTDEITIKSQGLIYGGMPTMRDFITNQPNTKLDVAWQTLDEEGIALEEALEGGRIFDQFQTGKLGLEDLYIGDLKAYFAKYKETGEFDFKLQRHEYAILNYYFEIERDHFLSLPVILFGKLEGVVHIIFKRKLKRKLQSNANLRSIIRGLSNRYETLFESWDFEEIESNLTKKSLIQEELDYFFQLMEAGEKEAKEQIPNKFFEELNFYDNYKNLNPVYEKRLEQRGAIPTAFKNENRRRAIISILIDSYSHNISAHSLTVLKWWFQQRASSMDVDKIIETLNEELPIEKWGDKLVGYLKVKFPTAYTSEAIGKGLQYDFARWYNLLSNRREGTDFKAVRDQFFPLEEELTPLFKLLLEKGAFWSGVTRDQQFGGEIYDLYTVLWKEFIQNPLYLGTIAYSEGITRLNIHIRVYSDEIYEEQQDAFYRTYQLRKDEKGETLDGVLATIDVGGVPNSQFRHKFIVPGAKHDLLKEALKQCEIFFPGGIVGKHAFFTILENEIRNVKHFEESDQEKMRRKGLDLVISIRQGPLSYHLDYPVNSLYKIGIWLGHETKLIGPKGHLVKSRFEGLSKDIITPDTYAARLGGTYQDKICSAMLFNNTFISVERKKSKRDLAYYPWVRAAVSEGIKEDGITEIDFEVNNRNATNIDIGLSKSKIKKGFYKKYIHLWKGAFIFHAKEGKSLNLENFNRFKIVNITHIDNGLRKKLLREGAIRILEQQKLNTSAGRAYHYWLLQWLKVKYFAIRLLQGDTEIGYIFFDERQAKYFQTEEFEELSKRLQENYGEYPESDLCFAHDSFGLNEKQTQILSIRSNGVLREKFFPNVESVDNFSTGEIEDLPLYELIEVLQTKICIFDNRIAGRIPDDQDEHSSLIKNQESIELNDKRELLSTQLKCIIYGESKAEWDLAKASGFEQYHFIVVHLSFIESLKGTNGQPYGEAGIVDFIEEQLTNKLQSNCILVITTGRGRTEWWRKIEESKYAIHTTFRPIESLIEAVEKGILKRDDIELKYNLIKVLFGS